MITSTANVQVKNLVLLKKKAKERKEKSAFIIEGLRMFEEAPADRIVRIYVTERFTLEHRDVLDAKLSEAAAGGLSVQAEMLGDAAFCAAADTKSPQGVLCVVRMAPDAALDDGFAPGMWLMLERIQDPGNLGTMFRTAEAAGAAGIIMDAGGADVYAPKVVRSTMGSIFRVPFVITRDLRESIASYRAGGGRVYAAGLTGSIPYDEADYTGDCAVLIGNEANGLTAEALAAADCVIRIPMAGAVESLNAAMAASVILFEGSSQRRHA